MLRTTFILLFVIGLQGVAWGQVNTSRIDTVVIDSAAIQPAPAIAPTSGDQSAQEEKKELFKVTPWQFHAPLGSDITATDSTLRWQIWPDWTYKLNRKPGVISYRLGTSIRSNAVQRYAHEPRHQQLYWEDIALNDPVTGTLNWSLIPQHKIDKFYSQDLGTQYRSTYYLRQYYLNKPLSRLIYSESKYSFRNLEFEVSHNLSQRTNVELSYWDRRAGGEFNNSEIIGRQIFAKVSHHLDHRRFLKINYISNNYDIGQPFGYAIPDLRFFNFDRFSATPNRPSASSKETNNLFSVNFYQRSPDSTQTIDNLHAGLYFRGTKRRIVYSDTAAYNVPSVGTHARKWWEWGGLKLESAASYEYYFNNRAASNSLLTSDWSLLKTEGQLVLDYTPIIDLKGGGAFQLRSDGFQAYRLNATSDIVIGNLTLTPGLSSGSIMPTPQQLYWQSDEYGGNVNLRNEKIQEAQATLSYQINDRTKLGIRGQHKDISNGIMVVDSTFTNVNNYASQSGTIFFEWNLTNFEFNGSATAQRYTQSFTSPSQGIPMLGAKRVWLKGGAYWKGYLFDRATYIKAGLSGMMAPFRYQADHYSPVLDSWQPVSNDQLLPVYNRLDVDVTARVRSIMFILRWENVLDDVNQLGYFEAAQYPMSGRRFIFGVRALFRN